MIALKPARSSAPFAASAACSLAYGADLHAVKIIGGRRDYEGREFFLLQRVRHGKRIGFMVERGDLQHD